MFSTCCLLVSRAARAARAATHAGRFDKDKGQTCDWAMRGRIQAPCATPSCKSIILASCSPSKAFKTCAVEVPRICRTWLSFSPDCRSTLYSPSHTAEGPMRLSKLITAPILALCSTHRPPVPLSAPAKARGTAPLTPPHERSAEVAGSAEGQTHVHSLGSSNTITEAVKR